MASIFELFDKRNQVQQNILKLEELKVLSQQKLARLRQLYPQEYQSEQQKLEAKTEAIQDELAYRLSLVFAYIQQVQNRADKVLLTNMTDILVNSSRLILSSHLLLDHIISIIDGEHQVLRTPSRQISATWEDEHWWKENVANSYSPRTEGLVPILIRVGTLRVIQRKQSKFFFDFDEWSKKEEIHKLFAEAAIDLRLDKLPLLLKCRCSKLGTDFGHIAIFTNSPETRQAATAALESIALRAIATFPARKLQGIFIDPVSMGMCFPC